MVYTPHIDTLGHGILQVKVGLSPQILGDEHSWNLKSHENKVLFRPSSKPPHRIHANNTAGIASEIKRYGELGDLTSGRYLHAQLTIDHLDDDRFLGNCLVEMYGSCNRLEDAKYTFDNMPSINLYTWNILINAYVKNGMYQGALTLYHQMQDEFQPDDVTFLSILNACIEAHGIEQGRSIHADIIESGYCDDIVVKTALLNFYGKCGRVEDAIIIFDGMPYSDLILRNAMIAAYTQNGYDKEALNLFETVKKDGCSPNQATFVCILDACGNEQALDGGYGIHSSVVEFGLAGDIIVETALLDMYSKCASLEDSKQVFEKMQVQNVVSWSAMIAACVHNGNSREGLELFHSMEHAQLEPNRITMVSAIDACAGLADLEEGWKLHASLASTGDEDDIVAATSLVNMYGECGSIDDAKDVFDEMRQLDTVSCTTMIRAHACNGGSIEALGIFCKMEAEGFAPNCVTFVCLLDACASLEFLAEEHKIHSAILTLGYEMDVVVGTALISMYGKCGCVDDLRSVWSQMPHRNAISFNAMIVACTDNGYGKEALGYFHEMYAIELQPNIATFVCTLDACGSMAALEEGRTIHSAYLVDCKTAPEVAVGNALIVMYGRCGSVEDAKSVFHNMSQWDVVSWTALIAMYAQNGSYEDALTFFNQMQLEGFKPNHVTFVSALDACTCIDSLDQGWKLHASVIGAGFETKTELANALVNLYGMSGILSDAKIMFERFQRHDLVSWNTLIAVFARNGYYIDTLDLFNHMLCEGLQPDHITFLNVLTVCSHSGRVDDARHYFSLVKQVYGLDYTCRHYVRLVDLLGRAGHLDDAEDLINVIPFEESSPLWSRLLGSCKIYGDVERAVRAAAHIFTLDPDDQGSYVTLASMCAAAST